MHILRVSTHAWCPLSLTTPHTFCPCPSPISTQSRHLQSMPVTASHSLAPSQVHSYSIVSSACVGGVGVGLCTFVHARARICVHTHVKIHCFGTVPSYRYECFTPACFRFFERRRAGRQRSYYRSSNQLMRGRASPCRFRASFRRYANARVRMRKRVCTCMYVCMCAHVRYSTFLY